MGRALEDPLQGTRALRSANIILDESQKEQIKRLVEQGDKLGAQRYILDLLAKQVGGSAKRTARRCQGKLERAKNAFDDVKASVVGSAAPAARRPPPLWRPTSRTFTKLPQPLQTGILLFGRWRSQRSRRRPLTGAKTVLSGMGALFDKAATGAYDFAGRASGRSLCRAPPPPPWSPGLAVGIQKWQADMAAAEKAGTDTAKAIADRSAKDSLEGVEARLGRITTAMDDLNAGPTGWHGSEPARPRRRRLHRTDRRVQQQDRLQGASPARLEAARQLAAAKGISVEAAWREIQASPEDQGGPRRREGVDRQGDRRLQAAAGRLDKLASAKKSQYQAIVALSVGRLGVRRCENRRRPAGKGRRDVASGPGYQAASRRVVGRHREAGRGPREGRRDAGQGQRRRAGGRDRCPDPP